MTELRPSLAAWRDPLTVLNEALSAPDASPVVRIAVPEGATFPRRSPLNRGAVLAPAGADGYPLHWSTQCVHALYAGAKGGGDAEKRFEVDYARRGRCWSCPPSAGCGPPSPQTPPDRPPTLTNPIRARRYLDAEHFGKPRLPAAVVGRRVPLARLYRAVERRGGSAAVSLARAWGEVGSVLELAPALSARAADRAPRELERLYGRLLAGFERWMSQDRDGSTSAHGGRGGHPLLDSSEDEEEVAGASGVPRPTTPVGDADGAVERTDRGRSLVRDGTPADGLREPFADGALRTFPACDAIKEMADEPNHDDANLDRTPTKPGKRRVSTSRHGALPVVAPVTTPCSVCFAVGHVDFMDRCRRCSRSFHSFCLSPPLASAFEGGGACPGCSPLADAGGEEVPVASRASVLETLTFNELEQRSSKVENVIKRLSAPSGTHRWGLSSDAAVQDVLVIAESFWTCVVEGDEKMFVVHARGIDQSSGMFSTAPAVAENAAAVSGVARGPSRPRGPGRPPNIPVGLPPLPGLAGLPPLSGVGATMPLFQCLGAPAKLPPLADVEWGLRDLPVRRIGQGRSGSESVLRHLPPHMVGKARMDVGMCCSSLPWRIESHLEAGVSFLHHGAPRICYAVHPDDRARFEDLVARMTVSSSQHSGVQSAVSASTQLSSLLPPAIAVAAGIRVTEVVQRQGDIVIWQPGAYHCEVLCGASIAESCAVAPATWLERGGIYAARALATQLVPDFSFEAVIVSLADRAIDSGHGIPLADVIPVSTLRSLSVALDRAIASELRGRLAAWSLGVKLRRETMEWENLKSTASGSELSLSHVYCAVCGNDAADSASPPAKRTSGGRSTKSGICPGEIIPSFAERRCVGADELGPGVPCECPREQLRLSWSRSIADLQGLLVQIAEIHPPARLVAQGAPFAGPEVSEVLISEAGEEWRSAVLEWIARAEAMLNGQGASLGVLDKIQDEANALFSWGPQLGEDELSRVEDVEGRLAHVRKCVAELCAASACQQSLADVNDLLRRCEGLPVSFPEHDLVQQAVQSYPSLIARVTAFNGAAVSDTATFAALSIEASTSAVSLPEELKPFLERASAIKEWHDAAELAAPPPGQPITERISGETMDELIIKAKTLGIQGEMVERVADARCRLTAWANRYSALLEGDTKPHLEDLQKALAAREKLAGWVPEMDQIEARIRKCEDWVTRVRGHIDKKSAIRDLRYSMESRHRIPVEPPAKFMAEFEEYLGAKQWEDSLRKSMSFLAILELDTVDEILANAPLYNNNTKHNIPDRSAELEELRSRAQKTRAWGVRALEMIARAQPIAEDVGVDRRPTHTELYHLIFDGIDTRIEAPELNQLVQFHGQLLDWQRKARMLMGLPPIGVKIKAMSRGGRMKGKRRWVLTLGVEAARAEARDERNEDRVRSRTTRASRKTALAATEDEDDPSESENEVGGTSIEPHVGGRTVKTMHEKYAGADFVNCTEQSVLEEAATRPRRGVADPAELAESIAAIDSLPCRPPEVAALRRFAKQVETFDTRCRAALDAGPNGIARLVELQREGVQLGISSVPGLREIRAEDWEASPIAAPVLARLVLSKDVPPEGSLISLEDFRAALASGEELGVQCDSFFRLKVMAESVEAFATKVMAAVANLMAARDSIASACSGTASAACKSPLADNARDDLIASVQLSHLITIVRPSAGELRSLLDQTRSVPLASIAFPTDLLQAIEVGLRQSEDANQPALAMLARLETWMSSVAAGSLPGADAATVRIPLRDFEQGLAAILHSPVVTDSTMALLAVHQSLAAVHKRVNDALFEDAGDCSPAQRAAAVASLETSVTWAAQLLATGVSTLAGQELEDIAAVDVDSFNLLAVSEDPTPCLCANAASRRGDEPSQFVRCFCCHVDYHVCCMGLTTGRIRQGKAYVCPVCQAVGWLGTKTTPGSSKTTSRGASAMEDLGMRSNTHFTRVVAREELAEIVYEMRKLPCLLPDEAGLTRAIIAYDKVAIAAVSLLNAASASSTSTTPRAGDRRPRALACVVRAAYASEIDMTPAWKAALGAIRAERTGWRAQALAAQGQRMSIDKLGFLIDEGVKCGVAVPFDTALREATERRAAGIDWVSRASRWLDVDGVEDDEDRDTEEARQLINEAENGSVVHDEHVVARLRQECSQPALCVCGAPCADDATPVAVCANDRCTVGTYHVRCIGLAVPPAPNSWCCPSCIAAANSIAAAVAPAPDTAME